MSRTRILCNDCGFPQVYCTCKCDVLTANETGWISVKDRLPDKKVEVIVATRFNDVFTTTFADGHFDDCVDGYVTHWQALPEPPNTRRTK